MRDAKIIVYLRHLRVLRVFAFINVVGESVVATHIIDSA
jgi:hypothetical protein